MLAGQCVKGRLESEALETLNPPQRCGLEEDQPTVARGCEPWLGSEFRVQGIGFGIQDLGVWV